MVQGGSAAPEAGDVRERLRIAAPRLPPILCYHKIEQRLELGVTRISPRRFARQIERLARRGWRSLTLEQVLACARGERVAGPRELAITFDDAYRGLRDHAFPVLADHGWTAACFVITDYAGALNRWDVAYGGRRFAHLAWRDMRRWQERGMEFHAHTATHPRLTWLSEADSASELVRSYKAVAGALDSEWQAISWPYGAAGEREHRLASEAGFMAGAKIAGSWTGNLMSIPRLPVYAWAPPMPGVGMLRAVEWAGGAAANRCAVGTAIWQRVRGWG